MFQKRQKEMKRLEKQRADEERRAQKKLANRSEEPSGEHVNVSTKAAPQGL